MDNDLLESWKWGGTFKWRRGFVFQSDLFHLDEPRSDLWRHGFHYDKYQQYQSGWGLQAGEQGKKFYSF